MAKKPHIDLSKGQSHLDDFHPAAGPAPVNQASDRPSWVKQEYGPAEKFTVELGENAQMRDLREPEDHGATFSPSSVLMAFLAPWTLLPTELRIWGFVAFTLGMLAFLSFAGAALLTGAASGY